MTIWKLSITSQRNQTKNRSQSQYRENINRVKPQQQTIGKLDTDNGDGKANAIYNRQRAAFQFRRRMQSGHGRKLRRISRNIHVPKEKYR